MKNKNDVDGFIKARIDAIPEAELKEALHALLCQQIGICRYFARKPKGVVNAKQLQKAQKAVKDYELVLMYGEMYKKNAA